MSASDRAFDAKRRESQPWRSLYSTARWRAIRKAVLEAQPICRICNTAKSDTVDHVEKHSGDPVKFYAGPFQALCALCHNSLKQSWEKGRSQPIGLDGWPTS